MGSILLFVPGSVDAARAELVALLVPLAIPRKRVDSAWLLVAVLYLTPAGLLPAGLQISIALVFTVTVTVIVARGIPTPSRPRSNTVEPGLS
ncbi:MAG: hypothetical protein ACLP0J_13420 [Solirubrobacteraceae bacterium]